MVSLKFEFKLKNMLFSDAIDFVFIKLFTKRAVVLLSIIETVWVWAVGLSIISIV